MGQTSADIEREIESIRSDVSGIVEELERRARRAIDVRAQAAEHPAALGIVGFGVLAGAAFLAYNVISNYRESRKPTQQVKQRATSMADELGERLGRASMKLPLRLPVGNGETEQITVSTQKAGMLKNLLWMGLTAGTVALAGLLARRFSSAIWEAVMQEPPPTSRV